MPKPSLKKPDKSHQNLKAKQLLTGATLAGSLLLTPGSQPQKAIDEKPPQLRAPLGLITHTQLKQLLQKTLSQSLPDTSRVLTQKEEQQLSQAVETTLGLDAVVELDGNRLNHQLGLMGLEQNLMRYPGDQSLSDRSFPQVGIAPHKAAWGYWANNRTQLTENDIQMEKYYIAVQTMYLPDWQQRLSTLVKWYRYRKVLVVNPDNGAAVIAVIADAGPAKWTGKQFGGSPQVMFDLGFYPQKHKGKVLVLFLNDPDNQIALGPVLKHRSAPEPESI